MNHDSYNQTASYGQPSNHGAPGARCDFNDADAQQGEFNLIPKGTQALVRNVTRSPSLTLGLALW